MWEAILNFFKTLFVSPKPQDAPENGVTTPPPSPQTGPAVRPSWETGHPERKSWTEPTFALISRDDVFEGLDRASDITRFRTDYRSLTRNQRETVWLELFSSLAYLESSHNPKSASVDVGTKDNKDTWSVGLLQMSVTDQKNSGHTLGYTYEQLQEPWPNLRLGILIMWDQIVKYGKICIPKEEPGEYWSTLSPGYPSEQISTIAKACQALKFTDTVVPEPVVPPPVSSKLVLDTSLSMPTKGKFAAGGPKGMIVHFTAGQSAKGDSDARDTVSWGKKQGYAFWCCSTTGRVYKTHPENEWGSHAGESYWEGLGSSVSHYLLGLEVTCAGTVTKKSDGTFVSWFGKVIPQDQVRYSGKLENIQAGYYHKYTDAQFEAIVQVCFHLKRMYPNTFSFDYVLGHDEVAPKRKNDPGAALKMTMPQFRQYLKANYKG